ncbi:MAG: hypothetical protein HY549_06575 [Elusimicrobia bacterium]|nr:hypothetical protein [Elusimicrobiota bacterium]
MCCLAFWLSVSWPAASPSHAALEAGRDGTLDPHRAPAPSLAVSSAIYAEQHNTLAEMWQRRILSPETDRWTPADFDLLLRIRRAEAAGALGVLRAKNPSLKGLAIAHRAPGKTINTWRLTQEGYELYRLALAQEALAYFQHREIGAKWAFKLRTVDDEPVFDAQGLLTPAGEELYFKLRADEPGYWKTSAGELMGNRPPKHFR